VLCFLLPYIEQTATYQQIPPAYFDSNQPVGAWAYNGGVVYPAPVDPNNTDMNIPGATFPPGPNGTNLPPWCTTKIKSLICPSDDPYTYKGDPPGGAFSCGVIDAYWVEKGSVWIDYLYDAPPYIDQVGLSNYIGITGALGDDADDPGSGSFWTNLKGVFWKNSKAKLTDIKDGTSNTMMFGETLAGNSPPGQRDFALSWAGAGAAPTAWELVEPQHWYQYGSRHPGVSNFAFGDGSVRPILKVGATGWYSPRWYQFQYAAGKNDGQSIDWSQLTN